MDQMHAFYMHSEYQHNRGYGGKLYYCSVNTGFNYY